jgi:hypothetical protein
LERPGYGNRDFIVSTVMKLSRIALSRKILFAAVQHLQLWMVGRSVRSRLTPGVSLANWSKSRGHPENAGGNEGLTPVFAVKGRLPMPPRRYDVGPDFHTMW